MIEEEIIGSHTDDDSNESVQIEKTDIPDSDVFALFGIEKPQDKQETKQEEADADDPAKDQMQEPRTIKVKYNKEEVEVPEDKVPEYVQKGLALDKERERRSEYEKALDRAAKLQGFNDHADLMANLDRIEQEREEAQKRQYDELREKMIADLEYNGVSREDAISFLENNPVLNQAKQAMQEAETLKAQQEQAKQQQQVVSQWSELYDEYPDLKESAKVFNEGGRPDWYTDAMESMINNGYRVKDAFKLANLDRITQQAKKTTEQKVIKQQQLGLRAKVETTTTPDNEPQVSPALASAFEAFGLPVSAAKKYAKK